MDTEKNDPLRRKVQAALRKAGCPSVPCDHYGSGIRTAAEAHSARGEVSVYASWGTSDWHDRERTRATEMMAKARPTIEAVAKAEGFEVVERAPWSLRLLRAAQ